MRKRFFLLMMGLSLPAASGALSLGAIGAGCAPSVETTPGSGGAGVGGHGFFTTGVGPNGDDGGLDALPDYVDPGCPDAGPKMMMFQCDPYNQGNGDCMPGQGCYIFVQYPTDPCGQEVYGSVCSPAGMGTQGSSCDGPQQCGAGFVCVVSGSGTQCVQLCELVGNSGCPDGLVCEPIDVEGFGGCL